MSDTINVKALIGFLDKAANVYRYKGDEFAVTQERFEEINNAGIAQLGKPFVETTEKKAEKPARRKAK